MVSSLNFVFYLFINCLLNRNLTLPFRFLGWSCWRLAIFLLFRCWLTVKLDLFNFSLLAKEDLESSKLAGNLRRLCCFFNCFLEDSQCLLIILVKYESMKILFKKFWILCQLYDSVWYNFGRRDVRNYIALDICPHIEYFDLFLLISVLCYDTLSRLTVLRNVVNPLRSVLFVNFLSQMSINRWCQQFQKLLLKLEFLFSLAVLDEPTKLLF